MSTQERTRYLAVAVIALIVFALVLVAYVVLSIAGRDTDRYLQFLALSATTLPAILAAFRANVAASHAEEIKHDLKDVKQAVNGDLTRTVQDAVRGLQKGEPNA